MEPVAPEEEPAEEPATEPEPTTTTTTVLSHAFEKLVLVERVRATTKDVVGEKLAVPGIVVVGMQSSGKSSVLEHATGLAFPRGEGTCTRVPTTVTVQYVPPEAKQAGLTLATDPAYECNRVDVDPDDHEAFANAIKRLTDVLAPNGTIGTSPIYVKYSKHGVGPTFTITDVPGITFNSINDEDIETTTISLTRQMISNNDETLILLVLSGTDDIQNSKALKVAGQEDPDGRRTIGVVTKVDRLAPDCKLVEHATGRAHPLRHGYYAVRNRTQTEIEEEMSVAELERKEATLFAVDPVLSQVPREQCGMKNLLAKIVAEQELAIDRCLPKLKRAIGERQAEQRRELGRLPAALATDGDRSAFLSKKLALLSDLARRCSKADTAVLGASNKTTNLSARVHEKLVLLKNNVRHLMPNFLDEATKDALLEASNEALGYNLSNFMQGAVFRERFAGVVDMLEREAIGALDAVLECVRACLDALVKHVLPADLVAPKLAQDLCYKIEAELHTRHADVMRTIETLARAERNCTYTNNHYFAQTIAKFKTIVSEHRQNWKKHNPNHGQFDGVQEGGDDIPQEFLNVVAANFKTESNEAAAIRELQISLKAYGNVVYKRFADSVSILIKDAIEFQIVEALPVLSAEWAPALLESLVEDKRIAARRNELTRSLAALDEAARLLNEAA